MKKYSPSVDRETQHCQVSVLPKLAYGLSAVSAKIQAIFLCECQKRERERDSKVYMKWKKIQFGQHNTKEQFCRTDVVGLQEFLLNYSSQGNMENRQIHQWYKIGSPEARSYSVH